jgi:XTP/dITP diphosphohydrolase
LKLLLATHNEHKRREFERLLGGFEIAALRDSIVLPPEDGQTFGSNAMGKARAAAQACAVTAIADDSGISAAALGGGPGVRSARYAGERASDEENLEKLIAQVPAGSRLEYVCALAYVDLGAGVERIFEGRTAGEMARAPAGDGGFGYDPVFVCDDGPPGLTMAQLSDAEKDAISHRGRAARALLEWLGGARTGSTGG